MTNDKCSFPPAHKAHTITFNKAHSLRTWRGVVGNHDGGRLLLARPPRQALPQLLRDKRHEGVQQAQARLQAHPQRVARGLLGCCRAGGCGRGGRWEGVDRVMRAAAHDTLVCGKQDCATCTGRCKGHGTRGALQTHTNAAWLKAVHTRIVLVDDGLDELDEHIAQLVLPEGVDGLRQNKVTGRTTGLGRRPAALRCQQESTACCRPSGYQGKRDALRWRRKTWHQEQGNQSLSNRQGTLPINPCIVV